jgi:hypothetical protein
MMKRSSNPRLQRTPLRAPLSRKPLGRPAHRSMGRATRKRLLILVFAAGGCCVSGYDGDGKLVSRGFSKQFLVELGHVDLSKPGGQTFRMGGFASCNFVIGLIMSGEPRDTVVQVLMTNERGEKVVEEEAALGDWVWMSGDPRFGYFVYRAGHRSEEPISDKGDIRVHRVGEHADGGWGTFFSPRSRSRFILRLNVVKPTSYSATSSTVAVKSVVGSL